MWEDHGPPTTCTRRFTRATNNRKLNKHASDLHTVGRTAHREFKYSFV